MPGGASPIRWQQGDPSLDRAELERLFLSLA